MRLSDYANLGATDTEGRYFFDDLLDRTFGGTTMNPYEQCPNDRDTVESLALEIEELKGELSGVREFFKPAVRRLLV
jgi:hypothetical protein